VPRASGPDAGVANTLEAIVIAVVMVAAVAFVVTFQTPAAPSEGSRGVLEGRARDALSILGDEPVLDSALGTNLMSVATMECLQGNCSRLTTKLADVLPKGASYAVYLSNGVGLYPVYAPRSPPGEAISVDRLFEPQWSYAFLAPSMDIVNPTQDPMLVYDLPVFNSNVLTPQGHVLDVVVHGTRTSDGSDYLMRTSVATRAAASANASLTPAASLYFVDGSGSPIASSDLRNQTLSAGIATKAPVALTLRLNESAGVAIPAGANVTVQLPRGWNATASPAVNAADWMILSNATDANASASGADLVASLNHAVTSGVVDLKLNVTYRGDQDDHYVIRAAMSRGVYATASLLVTGDAHATLPAFEVPGVYLSAPRPMGATATTTWTLAANVPQSPSVSLSDAVAVTEIDITEETNASIFGSVTGVSSAGGSWTANGSALTWRGNATVQHFAPLNLTFRVAGSGLAGSTEDRSPFWPTVSLGGWSGRIADPSSPGVFRTPILPSDSSYSGYDGSTGAWVEANHTAASTAVYRATALPGTFAYSSGYATGMRDALFGSDVGPAQRRVATGGTANVSVNVQSLAYQLAELGMKPIITLKLYPPWTGDARVPIWSSTLYDAPALLGNASFLSVLDLNGDGTPDAGSVGRYNVSIPVPSSWLFGPYVLDAEVDWNDTLSAVVGNATINAPVVRAAHVYDYFLATPPNTLSPASPVYNARLVAWFDDWR